MLSKFQRLLLQVFFIHYSSKRCTSFDIKTEEGQRGDRQVYSSDPEKLPDWTSLVGPVVKNMTAKAGNVGWIQGLGKPHIPVEQLSPMHHKH